MSVTKDSVEVSIKFLTDETKEFARTIEETKKFQDELRKAQKNGGDVNAAIQKIIDSGKSLAGLDLKNVMPSQLTQRAKQLENALKFIPEMHPARVQMESELKAIADRMAEMNTRTRGVSSAMKQLSNEGSGFSKIFENAFSFILGGGVLGIISMIAGGLFNLGKGALKASADMESLKTAVEVFLGSGAAATKFLKDIQKFAADTPFEFPELAEAGKKLLAFGYSGDEAMKLLKRLGDVASAAQVPIGELAAIVGKAKLGQKIQGEELNQLADRGINVFPQLAKVLGTTEDKIKKLGSEGKIAYADLEKAIVMATEKGGQFYGMMDKQSQTFNGLVSTLTDNFNQFIQGVFGGIGEGLKPVIKGLSDFFGQLTELISNGKKPVGEYAEVIEYVATGVRLLSNVFGILWEAGKLVLGYMLEQIKVVAWLGNRVGDLIGWFVNLAQEAKKIPIIGQAFKPILDAIGLLSDLLSNASATFAGFRAAAQQAITNVQTYFEALVIDAEIVGSKIASALSFDAQIKANSQKEIAALEAKKDAMFKAGKTVEQAYTEGRNQAIAIQNKVEAEGEAKKKAETKAKAEGDEKDAKKAENDRLKRVKDALDLELKDKEIFYKREELVSELAFLKKEKTESAFNKHHIELERDKYAALIKVYDTYQSAFGTKTEQFRDLEIKKLEAQKKLMEASAQLAPRNTQVVETLGLRKNTEGVKESATNVALDALRGQADAEFKLNQQKFVRLGLSEIEFENRKAAIRKKYADEALSAVVAKGETEKGQLAKLNEQKIAADNNYHDTLRKNEQRTADLKAELEQVKLGLASQSLAVAIDLLSKDAEARKRNAAFIKAFQVGQIVVDGIAEVQGIWKNANSNPINALIPGAGTAIAVAQTAIAIGRSVGAIAKVNASKFARGGIAALKNGIFGGNSHSAGGTRGYFEDGTAVEVERDEAFVVVNKKNTPLLKALSNVNSFGGNGRTFFADGGVMNLDTNPSGFNAATMNPSVAVNINLDALTNEVKMLRKDVREVETTKKAYVVLDDFEAKQQSVAKGRANAAY